MVWWERRNSHSWSSEERPHIDAVVSLSKFRHSFPVWGSGNKRNLQAQEVNQTLVSERSWNLQGMKPFSQGYTSNKRIAGGRDCQSAQLHTSQVGNSGTNLSSTMMGWPSQGYSCSEFFTFLKVMPHPYFCNNPQKLNSSSSSTWVELFLLCIFSTLSGK